MNQRFQLFKIKIEDIRGLIYQAPVSKGKEDTVGLVEGKDIGYSTAKGANNEIAESIEILTSLQAPLSAGQVGGRLVVYKDGEELLSCDLLVANDLAKGSFLHTWRKLLKAL